MESFVFRRGRILTNQNTPLPAAKKKKERKERNKKTGEKISLHHSQS